MMGAASAVGPTTAASSGACRAMGSASDSTPSSRSANRAAHVKLFVIDAMRYTESAVGVRWPGAPTSRVPTAPATTTWPSATMPHEMLGQRCCAA